MKENARNYKFDNIRFILIFLVVLGHFLEIFPGLVRGALYLIIYAFHMPFFIFLTGYFAKFNTKKMLRHLIMPYLVFQILYLLFDFFVLKNQAELRIQFTTPYWILWYLLTVIFYYMIIPVIKTESTKTALIILTVTIFLSLISGFDKTVGYYLSMSRTIVFLPFFIAGYYSANLALADRLKEYFNIHRKLFTVLFITGFLICELLIIIFKVPHTLLYGSNNYEACGGNLGMRILVFMCSFFAIAVGISAISGKKYRVITSIGQNTMPIFLIHGFIQRLASKYNWFCFSQTINIFLALALTCAILLILGSKPVSKIFKKLF